MNKDFVSRNGDHLICLLPYISARSGIQNEISKEILAFKDGDDKTINIIFGIIASLSKKAKENLLRNSIIAVVPPSKTENNFKTPCHKLAQMVLHEYGKAYNMVDGTQYLYRYIDKKSAHQGGSRTIQIHLDTIKSINLAQIGIPRKIIIIDDIFTTGNSMEACYRILSRNFLLGDFFFLAIGRTILENKKQHIFICDKNNIFEIYDIFQRIKKPQLCSVVFVGNFNKSEAIYMNHIKDNCYIYTFNDIKNGIERVLIYAGVDLQEAYIVSNDPLHLTNVSNKNLNIKTILFNHETWQPFNSHFERVDIAITNSILNMGESKS